MAPKIVNIEITPDGRKIVDLDGFQGVGCAAVLEAFTKGDTVLDTKHKPEYKAVIKNAQTVCR